MGVAHTGNGARDVERQDGDVEEGAQGTGATEDPGAGDTGARDTGPESGLGPAWSDPTIQSAPGPTELSTETPTLLKAA